MVGNAPIPFPISGQIENPTAEMQIAGGNAESWLGYFIPGSVSPYVAFADIMGDLTRIQTQDWSMWRSSPSMPWSGSMIDDPYTINYGDLVIVKSVNPHTFQWTDQIIDPKYKTRAQNFNVL